MKLHNFSTKTLSKGLLLALALATSSALHAQTVVLDLKASDYNASTGVWTDSSGNGNNATSTVSSRPTLVTGVTPNGSSAVAFSGGNNGEYLTLSTGITIGNLTGYTAFVFLQPDTATPNGFTNGNGGTIFGGNGGAFQFRISSLHQDIVQQAQADLGHGNATLPISADTTQNSTNFSTIDTTTSPSGGTFRFNGTADGTSSGSNYGGNAISLIGTNAAGSGDEYFSGDIVEIKLYSGVLTDAQRQTVEQSFTDAYVTAIPEPRTWAMMVTGFGMLLMFQRRRLRRA